MIATYVRLPADRAEVSAYCTGVRERVLHCTTADDFIEVVGEPSAHEAVIDLFDWPADRTPDLVTSVRRRERRLEMLALHSVSHELDALCDMVIALEGVHSVFRPYHPPVGVCLRRSLLEWLPSGTSEIVRILAAGTREVDLRVLTGCVAAAERHTTLGRSAAGAGVSKQRVTQVLRRVGFASWCDFRAHARIWHAVYRMVTHRANSRIAAAMGGFGGGSHSLETHTVRHTGLTPNALRAAGLRTTIERATTPVSESEAS